MLFTFPLRLRVAAACCLAALLYAQAVSAITVTCVSTAADLVTTLDNVQTNGQDNYIKLIQGTYNLSASINAYSPGSHQLTIEGGYTSCGSAPFPTPDNTIINGADGLYFHVIDESGPLYVRNLTFSGFKPAAGTHAISFLDGDTQSTMRLENLDVTGNGVNGINDAILAVFPYGGLALDNDIAHDNSPAYAAVKVHADYTGAAVTVANNTIVNNQGSGLALEVYTLDPLILANNVLWNNFGADLIVDNTYSSLPPLALSNTYLNCTGCANLSPSSANNTSADPQLITGYRLGVNSPAINAGVPLPAVLPALDAANSPRVVGSAPDEGAYESPNDDLATHTYLVTSNGDDPNDILTLRGAITAANAAHIPARIALNFSLSGCPQIIYLGSPLPPITVPMVIDGYADPNSAPNTAAETPEGVVPFNATICTIVASGTTSPFVPKAISTGVSAAPNFHVEVRGVRFANFTTAIDLSHGYGNWIHGNMLGGNFIFGPVGNGVGVQVDGGFADVIGGPDLADRNLLSVSTGLAGVLITTGAGSFDNRMHTVMNNSIGGDEAGNGTECGNAYNGVELLDTEQQTIIDNYIVANGNDGIYINDSSYNLVRANSIGTLFAGNGSAGVHLRQGAGSNWIGNTDPLSPYVGNFIAGNAGPAVWIDYDAGRYNQVVNNVIYGNAGLSVDLWFAGVTANSGVEDSGPNYLLHKPLLANAVVGAPGKINVAGSVQTEYSKDYRYISIYAGGRCNDMEQSLGTYIVQADATGLIKFNLAVPAPVAGLTYITATDEDYDAGATDTSEQSNAKILAPSDDLFNDSFEGCP